MPLQALPCAGFDQMRQPLLAADIRPVQPSEILVAEHGKIHFNRGVRRRARWNTSQARRK
jgi:hypothetical protein